MPLSLGRGVESCIIRVKKRNRTSVFVLSVAVILWWLESRVYEACIRYAGYIPCVYERERDRQKERERETDCFIALRQDDLASVV